MRRLVLVAVRAGIVAIALSAIATTASAQSSVTIAGSLQSELGCPGDWQPECASTQLAYDATDLVWQGTFSVPAGAWEYKAALNGTWDLNYGAHAEKGGANIGLSLGTAANVKFYFDAVTGWITDAVNSKIVVAAGNFQSELGCPGDWQPDCLRSWLEDPDGDGVYTFTTSRLPAGSYEVKAALWEGWGENYGAGGIANGANIPFDVAADCAATTFRYDSATHVLTVTSAATTPQPASVTIAGNLQSELGCPGDWQPECATTQLAYDPSDGVWQGTFAVPAGSWEYKAALNGSWTLNYGAHAQPNGPNLALALAAPAAVKFYFDAATGWITDGASATIAVAAGNFQSELGCPGDWQPDCLRSWLEDPDGDGVFTFTTSRLPAGTYEAKVAIGESWSENYGAGGVRDGPNIAFVVPAACAATTFTYDASTHELTIVAGGQLPGSLATAKAHWLTADTIAWKVGTVEPGTLFRLHADPNGGLDLAPDGVAGGTSWELTFDPAGLSPALRAKYPHLASYAALKLPPDAVAVARDVLRGELAVSESKDGVRRDATALQIPGVLDDLYTYAGALGPTFAGGAPTLRVWAPTAVSVKVHLFDGPGAGAAETVVAMTPDGTTGTWVVVGSREWRWMYYLYEVDVFVRSEDRIVANLVTDPYSLALSTSSERSEIVDLADPWLTPPGFAGLRKPPLASPTDIVVYELHVRDFSASDPTVPELLRGTFLAFAQPWSAGMRHLRSLAEAGLTHVHLLPSFDFATVNEDRSTWQSPACEPLASYPPDSDIQQACVASVRERDGFNWGYDPLHYTVPEGSYSVLPDGAMRTWEFRAMVQALSRAGLRVVMDVVYNHTNAAGQSPRAVLDRVVPGYYHRLDADGFVETSTCCQNTATEHAMMEKLMVDSVVTWARAYKVDGFRFDLMGHHMKSNMLAVRAALDALTLDRDGVDGKKIYVYGEGWDFGEVAGNARGVNATQLNMAGTGIGTFSDRLRDRVRGGGPFSALRDQGFASGLALEPNGSWQGTDDEQRARLLQYADLVRLGLAGNLADYQLVDAAGVRKAGRQYDYNGQPAAYAARPDDTITYISAHDNETWFDAMQAKVPASLPLADRVRMDVLGLSVVALAQGVPFFHGGDDLLRSKSGDKNSYDSGDWFNRVDWTGTHSTWGSGLPPAGDNQANWPLLAPLLADPALAPGAAEMHASSAAFEDFLRIRRSTPLFRLRTAAEIQSRVSFLNVGPEQIPGLVVMRIVAAGRGEGPYREVVTLFNAAPGAVTFTAPELVGAHLLLHPVQRWSADAVVRTARFERGTGTFVVPGRTTAVFVR